MHYKVNRNNHDFQIIHFLAGACHTPDAAYALLQDLREDRENALKNARAQKIRDAAKILSAKLKVESGDPVLKLEGEADLADLETFHDTTKRCEEAAVAELETIQRCIATVEPHRRFKNLPDAEAHQAAQSEEWKRELIFRAENSLLTTGTIAADQFATMRMHPEFASEILPAINEVRLLMNDPNGQQTLMEKIERGRFRLPMLLGKHL